MQEPKFRIRDPIHGFIKLNDMEKKIVDTPIFRRLRYIRQLGMTYYVYPTAEHSRFTHSLGVLAVADKIFTNLWYKGRFEIFEWNDDERDDNYKYYRQILRLVALLHDVGHVPFSHTLERIWLPGGNHEQNFETIVLNTEIGGIIERESGGEIKRDDVVKAYLDPITAEDEFLSSIMNAQLDADRMDYLIRDSYFCGVDYGKYDLPRLLDCLTIYKEEKGPADGTDSLSAGFHLAIEFGGIQVLESLILARYFLFTQVMFHRTRRIYDLLLQEYVRWKIDNREFPADLSDENEFLRFNDNTVLEAIEYDKDKNAFANKIYDRKHPHWIEETPVHPDGSKVGEIDDFYQGLKEKLEPSSDIKLVYRDRAADVTHKLFEGIPEKSIMVSRNDDRFIDILELSPLLEGFKKPIYQIRVYADTPDYEKYRANYPDFNF